MKSFAASIAISMMAAPVYAQDTGQGGTAQAADKPATVAGKEAGPKEPEFNWEFSFAPTISSNFPMERGDSLSDYQTNSFKLGMDAWFSDTLKLAAEGGIQADFDGDDDSEEAGGSSIYGSAKLAWVSPSSKFSPFIKYTAETSFADILKDYSYTDHRVALGTGFQFYENENSTDGLSEVSLSFQVERLFSTQDDRQRTTPKVSLTSTGEIARGIAWDIELTAELRFFERHNEEKRQKDFRGTAFAGVDFAKRFDPKGKLLQEFKLGVRYIGTGSNKDSDTSKTHILPVITIGRTF